MMGRALREDMTLTTSSVNAFLECVSMTQGGAWNDAHLQRAQTEKRSGLDMVDDVHQARELWALIVRTSKD
jgi:hypothetical protein